MANTWIYREEWAQQLQDRLNEPNKWKDIADVTYTDTKTFNNPYVTTDPTVATITRGSAYSFSDYTELNETLVVDQSKAVPIVIDRADLAQSDFLTQMKLAERQATLLNEKVENYLFADHANRTDLGVGDITGGAAADTTQIQVSVNNIDDIIVNILRLIGAGKGDENLGRNGGFVVWRYADFALLRQVAFANGYRMADESLASGVPSLGGFDYMGLTNFASTQLTANHVFAGVKKLYGLGLLRSTYGQVMIDDKDPNLVSGISVVSRVDYGVKCWTPIKPLMFDVNVV